MYRLRTIHKFDAAHKLVQGDFGKCHNLHGHEWRVEIFVVGKYLGDDGAVVDFSKVKKPFKQFLDDKLDHDYVNEVMPEGMNTTAENIARWIYEQMTHRVSLPDGVKLEKIRVWETSKNYVEYWPDEEA